MMQRAPASCKLRDAVVFRAGQQNITFTMVKSALMLSIVLSLLLQ